VNRWLYGDRDDPNRVLIHLGVRLQEAIEPDAVLETIVGTIQRSLRVPFAEIRSDEGESLALAGTIRSECDSWPLTYQGRAIGMLRVAPRSADDVLNPGDKWVIGAVAQQAGLAVHAAISNRELQVAHARLVTLRDEERDRLRRDLHDGLGPQLASQTLTLDAAMATLQVDPVGATELLQALRDYSQSAIDEIRRIIYELRPVALEEQSLEQTLRDSVDGYRRGGMVIDLAMEDLPALPLKLEITIYRILHEALTNVVRHADATSVNVSLSWDEGKRLIRMQITDDGIGIAPHAKHGVGLDSMLDRAQLHNGRLTVDRLEPHGTILLVSLPLDA
jgi:signal transduction histidine kinase